MSRVSACGQPNVKSKAGLRHKVKGVRRPVTMVILSYIYDLLKNQNKC